MKKNVTALALVAAGFAAQNAYATVSALAVSQGSQIQIGCTAPSATGATVYSIDATQINALGSADTIAMPSGVSAGASCSFALNTLAAVTSVAGSSTAGRWVGVGLGVVGATAAVGANPVNVTIPGSGYSLIAYTLVAQ